MRSQPASKPAYSLIYVIHGDANYLYHNAQGEGLQADKHVLKQAKAVARKAKHGEVFIFHQNPERKILWLFPKKDRKFYYYREGKLVKEKKYSPHSNQQSFVTESTIYKRYSRGLVKNGRKIFLYFAHEVPERSDNAYYYSRADAPFNTSIFARGVQSFIGSGRPFNLIVLSTCNNGTPSMVQALTPDTRYVLASPQNLHLSHIDTGPLAALLENAKKSTPQIADSLAAHTYKRLASFLQTAVTLSVYDTRQTAAFLPGLARGYNKYVQKKSSDALLLDNKDCSRLPFFDMKKDTIGVKSWYKAPQFGVKKNSASTYSGWGCK